MRDWVEGVRRVRVDEHSKGHVPGERTVKDFQPVFVVDDRNGVVVEEVLKLVQVCPQIGHSGDFQIVRWWLVRSFDVVSVEAHFC